MLFPINTTLAAAMAHKLNKEKKKKQRFENPSKQLNKKAPKTRFWVENIQGEFENFEN